jgi:hypothetical protein
MLVESFILNFFSEGTCLVQIVEEDYVPSIHQKRLFVS